MSELDNENGNNGSVITGGGMSADGFLDGPGFGDDIGDINDPDTETSGSNNAIEFPEAISQSIWYEKIYDSDENSQTAKHLV